MTEYYFVSNSFRFWRYIHFENWNWICRTNQIGVWSSNKFCEHESHFNYPFSFSQDLFRRLLIEEWSHSSLRTAFCFIFTVIAMVYPNYFLWYNHLPSCILLNHYPFLFLFYLCIINLALGQRSSINSATSSRIFLPLFFFLSTILHLLFSFLSQPIFLFPSVQLLFYFLNLFSRCPILPWLLEIYFLL